VEGSAAFFIAIKILGLNICEREAYFLSANKGQGTRLLVFK
jgi:hypothetical protein